MYRKYVSFMDDKEFLTNLASGDMIALETKYHNTCGTRDSRRTVYFLKY